MKDAIDGQRPLDSLVLRTRRSDQGSLQAGAEALAAIAEQPVEGLVKQLQACVLWLARPSVAGVRCCSVPSRSLLGLPPGCLPSLLLVRQLPATSHHA